MREELESEDLPNKQLSNIGPMNAPPRIDRGPLPWAYKLHMQMHLPSSQQILQQRNSG